MLEACPGRNFLLSSAYLDQEFLPQKVQVEFGSAATNADKRDLVVCRPGRPEFHLNLWGSLVVVVQIGRIATMPAFCAVAETCAAPWQTEMLRSQDSSSSDHFQLCELEAGFPLPAWPATVALLNVIRVLTVARHSLTLTRLSRKRTPDWDPRP
eukprot:1485321-Rhodomonas_salina.2